MFIVDLQQYVTVSFSEPAPLHPHLVIHNVDLPIYVLQPEEQISQINSYQDLFINVGFR